ncbi:hypothetical protein [Fulvivirga sediminis]|uniref:Uncharacterized protein n=1 Tax=Fulvivirga sediminis TaxID=2803949 RepID=A0A937F5D4_9BACT|nr:hypothetical protein [Fulvivirga sediminis]MBL3656732.1 hypothetical protein [Fulvivirga sediminis]
MRSLRVFLPLFFITFWAEAQLNNTAFRYDRPVNEADSNALFLGINAMGFAKNNEYFNDIADGYTLFGYQLNPYLTYHPGKYIKIDAGVYLQKDFGNNGYREVTPTFSFKYSKKAFSLIFGTLEGSVSHRLVEPLYDFEKTLNDRLENGFQVKVEKERLFMDYWVDWQNMIYPGDSTQEHIVGGASVKWAAVKNKDFQLTVPLQFVVEHQGGQIDDDPEPLQTNVNMAAGVELTVPLSENSFVQELRSSNYYLVSSNSSEGDNDPLTTGSGLYINAAAKTKANLEVMASYWYGDKFTSVQGGQLYASRSSSYKNARVIEPARELLIIRLMHKLEIADGLSFNSRFEPFYDFRNGTFEYAFGFYINYTGDFFLIRNKKRQHD